MNTHFAHAKVDILTRQRVGDYFIYKCAVNGEGLRDTISIPAEYILSRSESDAKAFVERQARGIANLFAQQDRGEVDTYR